MLSVDDALAALLAGVAALPPEDVSIAHAHGRILVTPVTARLTQPPFDGSAMDGYAIRWADMPGPWKVVGESAAGRGWGGTVGPGEAARIFTGAPVPAGADTVVVQEDMTSAPPPSSGTGPGGRSLSSLSSDGDEAGRTRPPAPSLKEGGGVSLTGEGPPRIGAHIRRKGQDFAAGAPLLAAGTQLTPARLGLLAAAGHGSVPVVRRPRVTLIATGDELVPPGNTPGPGQIISSNSVMLAALLAAAGAEISDPGIIPDRREALAAALQAVDTDLIVTIGGASVGDHDLVVPVLRDLGADIDFWKIAMRPGKPMIAGRLGGRRVIGLPGNPVSAFVCALLFAVPLLRVMGGRSPDLPRIQLPLARALPANGPRRDHLRARVVDGRADPAIIQDSALLGVLAGANVLVIREAGAPAAAFGDIVDCIALDTFRDVA